METLGQLIKKLRQNQKLPLRKIAAALDLDQSTLSKIERGDRFPSKELTLRMAKVFELDERQLMIQYHSEKIAKDLYRIDYCDEVLMAAEEKIEYIRQSESKQAKLFE